MRTSNCGNLGNRPGFRKVPKISNESLTSCNPHVVRECCISETALPGEWRISLPTSSDRLGGPAKWINSASERGEQKKSRRNTMKKILLGTVALAALGMAAAPASAADLAARPYTKAPAPMMAAIYDWSGFYIGLNGGGGSSHKCWDILAIPAGAVTGTEGCHDATGGTVGGQIGYRWQSSAWVFGLEAQGNWANFNGSNTNTLFVPAVTDQSKINAFGMFTGQ